MTPLVAVKKKYWYLCQPLSNSELHCVCSARSCILTPPSNCRGHIVFYTSICANAGVLVQGIMHSPSSSTSAICCFLDGTMAFVQNDISGAQLVRLYANLEQNAAFFTSPLWQFSTWTPKFWQANRKTSFFYMFSWSIWGKCTPEKLLWVRDILNPSLERFC